MRQLKRIFRPKKLIFVQKSTKLDEKCARWTKTEEFMRNFDYSQLSEKKWNSDILNLVAKIHECKGKQDLFIRQKPVELNRLVEIAKIQSTEASNKIEGIVTTSTRMKQLFEEAFPRLRGHGNLP